MRAERLVMVYLQNPIARAVAEKMIEEQASRLAVTSDGAAVRKRKDPVGVLSRDVFGFVAGSRVDADHQFVGGLAIVRQNPFQMSRAVDRFREDRESRTAQA